MALVSPGETRRPLAGRPGIPADPQSPRPGDRLLTLKAEAGRIDLDGSFAARAVVRIAELNARKLSSNFEALFVVSGYC